MKILVTGGAGFLGQRLARTLLKAGRLTDSKGTASAITELVLLDTVAATGSDDPRVRSVVGDISDSRQMAEIIDRNTASVFHLAAIVSGQAEADFDLGMHINIDALRTMLDICRTNGNCPKVLFTSSVAVFGGSLPEVVRDDTALNPGSSYGMQKAVGELLINEYSRRAFIDGRVLRLPTISVRPGKPNKAASSFASGIIREPLNGEQAICPVPPDTRLWLLSPRKAIDCLLRGHELPGEAMQQSRIINIPGVSVSAGEMAEALRRVAGSDVADRIRWEPDPFVARIVGSWPPAWDTSRAHALGLDGDSDFDSIIRAYIEDDR